MQALEKIRMARMLRSSAFTCGTHENIWTAIAQELYKDVQDYHGKTERFCSPGSSVPVVTVWCGLLQRLRSL